MRQVVEVTIGKEMEMKGTTAIGSGANREGVARLFITDEDERNDVAGKMERVKSAPKAIGGGLVKPVDPKAFKGKGVLWELRRIDVEMTNVGALMKELASITTRVPGKECALICSCFKGDYRRLRWRIGVNGLSDDKAWVKFQSYSEPRRSWYLRVMEQASELNARYLSLRQRRRELLKVLPTAPVYAREP